MSISFGGLASGIDTQAIIDATMEVERIPLQGLEDEKSYLQSKKSTYSSYDSYLNQTFNALEALSSEEELTAYTTQNGGSDYFSVDTDSLATQGTYQIEVISLAQQQKDVSQNGVADIHDESLSGQLIIGDHTLDYADLSLNALSEHINEGDYGVSASIINDGTENGYRLLLTAETSGTEIGIVGSGDVRYDTTTLGHTQDGQQAHIRMDGIDIYSETNTLTEAIKGVTLDLLATSPDAETSYLKIETDTNAIEKGLQSFISAYNSMLNYIDTTTEQDPSVGRQMYTVERQLQSLMTRSTGSGSYSSLAMIGLETDSKTGVLSLDTSVLGDALEDDYGAVSTLLAGDGSTSGVMTAMYDYMDSQVADETGFLAVRETSIDSQIESLDSSIERMESRLEKREETLEAQYAALELTMSSLNAQADYLTSYFEEN